MEYETDVHKEFLKFLKKAGANGGVCFIFDENGDMLSDGSITNEQINRVLIEVMHRALMHHEKVTKVDAEIV